MSKKGVRVRDSTKQQLDSLSIRLTDSIMPKDDPAVEITEVQLKDAGNAEFIAEIYGDTLRFDNRRNRWLLWGGNIWEPDKTRQIYELATNAARKRIAQVLSGPATKESLRLGKLAIDSLNSQKLAAAINLARSKKPLVDDGESWDLDPMLLGCNNGVLDLREGKLRGGKPEDRITMTTGITYESEAVCPRWEQFLQEVFQGNDELIHFVHKCLGYSICGSTKEEGFFIGYGAGANGKSKLFEAVANTLGDYAQTVPSGTLKRQTQPTISNDVARMEHKRFIVSSEALEAVRLDEEKIKSLTGGDKISARALYKESEEFTPVLKLWIFTNHKPIISDTSHGFWRRVIMLPFNRKFTEAEKDLGLKEKLASEAPGILQWLVQGCLLWQQEGLYPKPSVVTSAVDEYQRESDVLADFLYQKCTIRVGAEIKAGQLFALWKEWGVEQGMGDREIGKSNGFGRKITERGKVEGFAKVSKKDATYYVGIGKNASGGGLNDDFSLEVVDSDPIPVNPSRESSAKKYREMTFNSPPRHEITPQSTTDDGFDDPSRHDVTGSTPFSVNPSGDPPRREFTKNDPQPVMQARNLPKPVISELFEKSDVPEWSDIG